LEVATKLLAKKTLDEISIVEICEKAGVSVGAFHHHFTNKAGIIIELYNDIDLRFEEEVYPSLLNEDPIEAIYKYLETQCSVPSELGVDLVKNVYKAQIDYGNNFFRSEGRGLPHALHILIDTAIDCGKLRKDVSAEELTNELLIISRGIIYNWCVCHGETDATSKVRWMASNYLKSFLT
jgi:AcrR family transcriptional regulator